MRLTFIWWGAYIYYPNPFYFGDSLSYTQAFLNLWHKGIYSFDLTNPDAYFGRLPAYPLFYGLHYIIFGEKYVYLALAHSQAIIEILAISSLFFTLKRISTINAAYIGTFLYVFYPFTIIWITPVFTESIATSLTIIFFYLIYNLKRNNWYPVYLSVFIALCFYTREYLGILIVSAGIGYIIFSKDFKEFLKWTLVSSLVFGSLYSLWPIRNYITTGRVIWIKTVTSGYNTFNLDMINSRQWLYAWTDSANYVLEYMYDKNNIVEKGKPIYLPSDVAPTQKDENRIYDIMNQSMQCGSSFRLWQKQPPLPTNKDCTKEVARLYDSLFYTYKSNNPVKYYISVPSKNLYKSFFKTSISDSKYSSSKSNDNLSKNLSVKTKNIIIELLFNYRTFLILVGFTTLFILSIKQKNTLPISFFILFMYFFITSVIRQVEMRYLLQADTLLLLFSAIGFDYCLNLIQKKSKNKLN
ncbi:glycosyltransferase family 39 protein [Bernardetia litoralis]|uniref:glycosyltransferase family 39 protein n=1 Tax=Bernardetia litoralis TaxID=999 RepID=UPI0012FE3E8A|nr:glycosyltransferase family 39 protein [Bernardetia litoralis]